MEDFKIVEGGVYVYTALLPRGCKGHLYRVHRFCLAVPSYQEQVLVGALTGHDAGLWFVCSPANFATRYVPAEALPEPEAALPAERAAGYVSDNPHA